MKRLKYFFDRKIASGTGTLLLWIGILSLGFLCFFATLITIIFPKIPNSPGAYLETFWTTLAVALDPGVVTDPG